MFNNRLILFACILLAQLLIAQNIKTIQLKPLNSEYAPPIVRLGSILELSFDDLDADNKEYQYNIQHMTHDWKPSDLLASQYVNGYETDYITDVTNSFNTLQDYSHYTVRIPNDNSQITKSGNYLISIIDENDEVVFTRRCVFYQEKTTVGVSVKRSRDTKTLNQQQTVNFIVSYAGINISNVAQEIKVVLFQNNNWNTAIYNLQPQFFKTNQLVYNYTNKTNFWGGNEFLNFDTKNIRNSNLNIASVERRDVYHNYLFSDIPRNLRTYTFNPDINGAFVVRTLESEEEATEADYATMHFALKTLEYPNKDVYVYGGFNNFELTETNKMVYNNSIKSYETSIPLKQGFYNYNYVTLDENDSLDLTAISGSFFETENQYTVIVYYKPFGELYYSAIGVGNGYFNQNK